MQVNKKKSGIIFHKLKKLSVKAKKLAE